MGAAGQVALILAYYVSKLQGFCKAEGVLSTQQPEQAIPAGLVLDNWLSGHAHPLRSPQIIPGPEEGLILIYNMVNFSLTIFHKPNKSSPKARNGQTNNRNIES